MRLVCDLLISFSVLQMCLEDKTCQDIIHVKLTGQVIIHLERMMPLEHLTIVTCAMGYDFSYCIHSIFLPECMVINLLFIRVTTL